MHFTSNARLRAMILVSDSLYESIKILSLHFLACLPLLISTVLSRYTFDYHDDDIYWCTADIGWITGHSYIVYGPMANGATQVMVRKNNMIRYMPTFRHTFENLQPLS